MNTCPQDLMAAEVPLRAKPSSCPAQLLTLLEPVLSGREKRPMVTRPPIPRPI